MGADNTTDGDRALTTYLLDTTVLIGHLRGLQEITRLILDLTAHGHGLGTSCVNVAELYHGTRSSDQEQVKVLVDRLELLETTREASTRAGNYQARYRKQGITINTADALVAGTARAHGAVLVTDNQADFPMEDIRVVQPSSL